MAGIDKQRTDAFAAAVADGCIGRVRAEKEKRNAARAGKPCEKSERANYPVPSQRFEMQEHRGRALLQRGIAIERSNARCVSIGLVLALSNCSESGGDTDAMLDIHHTGPASIDTHHQQYHNSYGNINYQSFILS